MLATTRLATYSPLVEEAVERAQSRFHAQVEHLINAVDDQALVEAENLDQLCNRHQEPNRTQVCPAERHSAGKRCRAAERTGHGVARWQERNSGTGMNECAEPMKIFIRTAVWWPCCGAAET